MALLFFFFLLGLMVYPNVRLANRVGQNGVLWGFISVVFFFFCYFVLGAILILIMYGSRFLTQPQAVAASLRTRPFAEISILLFGVGGILLARYILEQIGKRGKRPH